MRTFAFAAVLLLGAVAGRLIAPDYQSLMWKYDGGNFWSPLYLNTTAYALESSAGAAPEALNRRSSGVSSAAQYMPCTVVTLDELSAKAIAAQLEKYRSLKQDVWSDAQFGECLYVQTTETSVPVDAKSLCLFFAKEPTIDVFLPNHYNVTSFGRTIYVHHVSAEEVFPNGAYIVATDANTVTLTPAYSLQEDVYESFMSGAVPNPASEHAHLTLQVSLPGTTSRHKAAIDYRTVTDRLLDDSEGW